MMGKVPAMSAMVCLCFCLAACSQQSRRWCKVKELLIQHKIFNQHIINQLVLESIAAKASFKLYCPNVKQMKKALKRHPSARTFFAICLNWLVFINKILNDCKEERRHKKYAFLKDSLHLLIEEIPTNIIGRPKRTGFSCKLGFPVENEDNTMKTIFDYEVIKAMHVFFSMSYRMIRRCS
ncbi:unnamed protein product [Acanthoscelides obtectus]|uniref:Uncharacterized protein n=1 Tax=Acanthoscelides obtectus TaxID=200917 RepID=A0A9P0PS33_ACAOB|nr:unnamed protein product [Acanthoscelides obtectus]CAK1632870.1 hypothetical protein AOBTE_LOCUS7780 [Acanthoscelides obtectus]